MQQPEEDKKNTYPSTSGQQFMHQMFTPTRRAIYATIVDTHMTTIIEQYVEIEWNM